MSCDVEDYFQVSAFNDVVPRDAWSDYECRIPANVDRILELFDRMETKGTFFTLGWVGRRYPEVVRRIAEAGHEVASHGMSHERVWRQTETEFLADVTTTRKILEDISGTAVVGFRAASWSFDERTPWAHAALDRAGYRYSSSIYPISHDHFGVPDAPTSPYYPEGGDLLEIPASIAKLFGRNIPASGGGYFRLYPYRFFIWLLRHMEEDNDYPCMFYFHPWEMDPEQPRIAGASLKARFRHYLNLRRFEQRLTALLAEFKWSRMDAIYLSP